MTSAYYSRAGSYSRSYNAGVAETEGRAPLTRAAGYLAAECKITVASAKRLLAAAGTSEWHHVGKYATAVDYCDWQRAAYLLDCPARDLAAEGLAGEHRACVLYLRRNRAAQLSAWQRAEASRQRRAERKADDVESRRAAQRDRDFRAQIADYCSCTNRAAKATVQLIRDYLHCRATGRNVDHLAVGLQRRGINPETLV